MTGEPRAGVVPQQDGQTDRQGCAMAGVQPGWFPSPGAPLLPPSHPPRCFPEVTNSHSFSWVGPQPRGETLFSLEMRSQRAAVEENPNPVVYERGRDEMPALKLAPTPAPRSCAQLEKAGPHLSSFLSPFPCAEPPARLAGCLSTRDFFGLIHLWAQPSPFPGCRESSFMKCPGEGLEGEIFEEGMSCP